MGSFTEEQRVRLELTEVQSRLLRITCGDDFAYVNGMGPTIAALRDQEHQLNLKLRAIEEAKSGLPEAA